MGDIIKFKLRKREKGVHSMESISKERMLEIEDVVKGLLENVDFENSTYVDIVSLVEREGFQVQPEEMEIETTGYLLVNDERKNRERTIGVNTHFRNSQNDTDVVFKKSRLITAHEYGHFKLHKEEDKPIYAHRDTYHKTEEIELEADYFARSILLPLDTFRLYCDVAKSIYKDKVEVVIETLSEIFKVTKKQITKRMEDLAVLVP